MSGIPTKIFLIGFQGSGKSTVGKLLAGQLKYRFVDTDTEIMKTSKMSIPQVFAGKGEPYFRWVESKIIADVCKQKGRQVISLGGGSFLRAINRKRVEKSGVTIYLKCSQAELLKRTRGDKNRPLLKTDTIRSNRQAQIHLKQLLQRRLPGYKTADMTFNTTLYTPKLAAKELLKTVKAQYAEN